MHPVTHRVSTLLLTLTAGLSLTATAAPPASAASVATWDKVAQCESGGNWSINTGNGYYGGLQINLTNWQHYGGTDYAARPDLAGKKQQILIAEKILADQGAGAWSCAANTGLSTDTADPYPEDTGPVAMIGDTGNPAAAVLGDRRAQVFLVQGNGGLATANESGGGWGSLSSFAEAGTAKSVSTAVDSKGRAVVFALQSNGGVATRTESAAGSHSFGNWSFVAEAGAAVQATAVRFADGRLGLVVVQSNGGVAVRAESTPGSGRWGAWTILTSDGVKSVTAGVEADGRIHLFALQTNGGVAETTETAPGTAAWRGWSGGFAPAGALSTSLPAAQGSSIAVAGLANGALSVVIVQSNGGVSTRYQTSPGGPWSADWGSLAPAGAAKSAALARHKDGRLSLVVVQSNGGVTSLVESTPNGPWNESWRSLAPAQAAVSVNTVLLGDGRVDALVVQSNGGVAGAAETSPGSGVYTTDWEQVAPAGAVSTS
ncbi:transglycosylase family protein [Streptomyces sp. NPDC048410]|uniref:transglycosylase family protein n=1 Tax=Streptomyces sp. NPDC048410 TaxID=3365545 RepID=UPI003715CC0D